MNNEDVERLSNMLAMLVSDSGEADNAGRAVGSMARRLGLTGGQLKAIFLAGVQAATDAPRHAEQTARVAALNAEVSELREALRKAEVAARSLQRERDALRTEAETLHEEIDQRRTARLARLAMGAVAVLAVLTAIWFVADGPRLRLFAQQPVQNAAGSPFYHTAIVRDRAGALHSQPDLASPIVTTVPIGTRLTVHRTLWHDLQQWVEVEQNGQTGYVLSTDVDLS